MAFDTGPSARSRLPGFATLVGIEALLAAGFVGWWVAGGRAGVAALGVAALVALTLVPITGRQSLAGNMIRRLGFYWSRARRRLPELAPAPFDVPTSGRQQRTSPTGLSAEDGPLGVRWAGGTMITVLRVSPARCTPTFLSPFGCETAEPELPLATLAGCINPFDIPLSSIDVITHGVRVGGAGQAAAIYERTLGPLPATTHRSTFVVLRLDPTQCPSAVARRGGGATGALRTATITTRRVARRLRECGLVATPLTASEMDSLTTQLTHGSELSSMREEWSQVMAGRVRFRTATIDPRELPRVFGTACPAALATTLTLTLSHGQDGNLRVRALMRVDDVPDAGRVVDTWPTGATPLDGRQFDALAASLPYAAAHRVHRGLHATSGAQAHTLLDALRIQVSGCGQLIGADHTGRAVTSRLFGPGISEVSLVGDTRLAAQVVLRIVATGGRVVVHTSRPDGWQHLVARVGDHRVLTFADPHGGRDGGGRIHLFDGVAPRPVSAGTTRIVVTHDQGSDNESAATAIELNTVEVRQDRTQPHDVTLRTSDACVRVTMVATPEESSFTGPLPGQPTPYPGRPKRSGLLV